MGRFVPDRKAVHFIGILVAASSPCLLCSSPSPSLTLPSLVTSSKPQLRRMKLSVDMESVAGSHGTTCHHSPSGSSDQLNSFYLEPESDPPVPFSSSPVTSSPGCIITPSEASPREVDLNCKSELSNIMSHGPSMVLKRASETFSPSGITSVGTNLLGTEIYSILDDSDNGDAYSDVSGPAFICANSALSDPGQPAFVEELDALLRDVIKDQGLYQSGSSASVSPAQGGQYAAQDGDDTSPVDLKFAASGISNLVSSSPYQGGSVDNISKAMSVSLSPSSSMNVLEHLVLDSGCGSSSESSLFQAFGRDSQSGSFATVVLPTTDEPTSYPSIPGTGPRREAPSVLAEDPAPLGSGNVSLRTPSLSSLNKAVPLAPKKMLRHASLYHESRTPSIPCKRTALDVDPTRLLATGKTSNSESNHDAYMQGLALKAETNSSLAPIVPKKRKISRLRSEQKQDGTDGDTELAISTTSANDSHHFASKPASLRKAASLLSNPSPTQVHHSNKVMHFLTNRIRLINFVRFHPGFGASRKNQSPSSQWMHP